MADTEEEEIGGLKIVKKNPTATVELQLVSDVDAVAVVVNRERQRPGFSPSIMSIHSGIKKAEFEAERPNDLSPLHWFDKPYYVTLPLSVYKDVAGNLWILCNWEPLPQ